MTDRLQLIPWYPSTQGGPLGRHIEHDERSKNYVAETLPLATTYHTYEGEVLDQTCYGACTGFSGADDADTTPDFWLNAKVKRVASDALQLYSLNTRNDGFGPPYFNPGDACGSPGDRGSSGLGMAKSMVQLGWATSYQHCFDINTVLGAIVKRPVSFGSNWYDSMDTPDSNGVVSISTNAAVRGGHEYTGLGIDVDNQLVQCINSWGPSWGVRAKNAPGASGGIFYISWNTLEVLLSEQGDCTVPVKAKTAQDWGTG